MKIIHRGTPEADKIFIGKCNSCGSIAEAKKSELKNVTYDYRERNTFSWEICPVCKLGNTNAGYGGMLFYPKKDTRD